MTPLFYTFWAINGALDQSRLRRQLDQFKAVGLDGVVFHPRFYPNDPPYLSDDYLKQVSDAILHAKSIGLAFWIYDEDGWPSGTVGGQLLKKFPNDAQRRAELVTEKPERCLCEFEHDGIKWFLAERIGAGVDYFNPDLTRHFLELTHERYRTGLAPEAWQHVETIFCDEPEFGLGHAYNSLSKHGAIPWTPNLPELFRQRHGEDLLPLIPKLFFSGDNFEETRVQFWELLTDIFNESFTAPINDWCKRHGKLFTAHVKGEEHPLFQVPTSGSCSQFFRNLSLPGIDALERFPSNHFYPRQASSSAQQFGDAHCMVEAFGGAGWGATPEDLERYLLWLGRHGLTDFVLHLSQYQLTSAAIRDWPPSQPLHLNWSAAYSELLRRVREELQKNPPPPADTLVIAPFRGIMAHYEPREFLQTNVHNATTYPDSFTGKLNRRFLEQVQELYDAGMPYHLTDERTLEAHGVQDGQGLRIGNCVYKNVIVADGARLNEKGLHLLEQTRTRFTEEIQIQPRETKIIQTPATIVSVVVKWSLLPGCVNALLLEPKRELDGWFTCEFSCATKFSAGKPLEVFFADAITEFTFNGNSVHLSRSKNGTIGRLGQLPIKSINKLHFHCVENVTSPFVWLRGKFRVFSRAKFTAGQNGTIATRGPFFLAPLDGRIDGDLVQAGFPFLNSPLIAETVFKTARATNFIQLDEIRADAARVTLDGADLGWVWGPDWKIAAKIKKGIHTLQLELIPNGFNYFGPHHYFAGDHHVISPDQFTGKKNFADADDAPKNTRVKAWHFRPLQLPQSISIS
ncbi:MAG TPA: hypothetical protein VGH42_12960 [Verrucomicrobiae bacterium]|jgi:hypothetical protein